MARRDHGGAMPRPARARALVPAGQGRRPRRMARNGCAPTDERRADRGAGAHRQARIWRRGELRRIRARTAPHRPGRPSGQHNGQKRSRSRREFPASARTYANPALANRRTQSAAHV